MSKPAPVSSLAARRQLSPNIAALGWVSMLTAMSSSMIYGLLPVFLVRVLGASAASVAYRRTGGGGNLSTKVKPVVRHTLSAIVKTLFPLAGATSTVLVARVADRLGKGIRDAPRDAFLADLTAPGMRGAGFGLRLALAIAGFVVGPFIAISLMRLSGDDFRLVFWIALFPAIFWSSTVFTSRRYQRTRRCPAVLFGAAIWPPRPFRAILTAGLLSPARFSPPSSSYHGIGVDASASDLRRDNLVYPICIHAVFADHMPRRRRHRRRHPVGADVAGERGQPGNRASSARGLQLGITQVKRLSQTPRSPARHRVWSLAMLRSASRPSRRGRGSTVDGRGSAAVFTVGVHRRDQGFGAGWPPGQAPARRRD
jgi:hypothetical protein